MSLLQIEKLVVSNPSNAHTAPLVDALNCDIDAGEILAIIGPNGAGKSTVLNAIAGDLNYHGKIQIQGISELNQMRARQLAVLPQLSLLNFPYRVSEVVELARIPHQTGKVKDREIVEEALALMDISFLKDRLYPQLSGGEKQRVQLARVLAQIWNKDDAPNGTRLMLLDEPTAALDLGHQQQLMQAIKDFAKSGVAIVIVLHDINLAAQTANKLLALLCGEQIAFGTVETVVTRETIKRLFNIETTISAHPKYGTPVVIS